ncbi:L,D-transpeptidase [Psychroserpens sp.]|uniref:L,D-transpeptidase n=1 Tax=Psychroserpens sp. TaxID=2020870 RepID=UPI002B26BDC0|nr:L,D-transpeptidase [Psychroserpens sp.]
MKRWVLIIHAVVLLLYIISVNVSGSKEDVSALSKKTNKSNQVYNHQEIVNLVTIDRDITIENYFQFMDSLVKRYDSITPYKLTEHLIVRSNSWILDTLQNTDYYRMMSRDSFVYDQKKMIALPKGNSIVLPDSLHAKKISSSIQKSRIDINIPEFKLRIYEDSVLLYEFPIRVGRNEKKYLGMSGRVEDLKTKTGEGHIIAYEKNPRYVNPANNQEYFVTNRDDKKVTKLPQIPFIEAEINGLRYGQLIHPTTNPVTLGKAYSNGCIGTREADAWVIYYYASIGTGISIRYDLNVLNEVGGSLELKDIYDFNKKD